LSFCDGLARSLLRPLDDGEDGGETITGICYRVRVRRKGSGSHWKHDPRAEERDEEEDLRHTTKF
jgi:hypothetical protein